MIYGKGYHNFWRMIVFCVCFRRVNLGLSGVNILWIFETWVDVFSKQQGATEGFDDTGGNIYFKDVLSLGHIRIETLDLQRLLEFSVFQLFFCFRILSDKLVTFSNLTIRYPPCMFLIVLAISFTDIFVFVNVPAWQPWFLHTSNVC